MEKEHGMTPKDKLHFVIVLVTIFFGIFFLGLVGLIFNIALG